MSSGAYRELKEVPLEGNLRAKLFELPNGLTVAVVRDPTTPVFSYQTWYRVGSADEQPGRQGLAHLFEHMMFRTTSTHPMGEFERIVNKNGGTGTNAFTSHDETVYLLTFPSDKLDLAATLESDRMSNLVIEPEMFETEKGAVITEKHRGLDEPGRVLWEETYKQAFTAHSYRYSTIGEFESIRSFSVAEAREFYSRYYAPNNALVVVAGDVDPLRVIEVVLDQYGAKRPADIGKRPSLPEPPQTGDRQAALTHPKASRSMMARVWHIPVMTHADYPALLVTGRMLTSGRSAILNQRLLYASKVTEVAAEPLASRDSGLFEFYAALGERESFGTVDSELHDALFEIASGSVSDEQLTIVKNLILKDLYRSMTSPSGLARLLGYGFVHAGDLSASIDIAAKAQRVDREDLRRVIRAYLLDRPSTTITLTPATGLAAGGTQ